jgi:hypothetical protein
VRKRVAYIQNVRSDGNTDLLKIAIADTHDAQTDLAQKDLSPDVQKQLSKAESLLTAARADSDANRPAEMKKIIKLLDAISAALFTTTPPDGSGGAGGFGGTAGSGGFGTGGTFGSGGIGTGGFGGTVVFGGAAGQLTGAGGTDIAGSSGFTGGTSGSAGLGAGGTSAGAAGSFAGGGRGGRG